MPTDNVRKTLLTMSKHSCFDEQGRQCLLQVVSLLNNLEAMSQDDHEFSLDDDHFSPMSVSIFFEKNIFKHISIDVNCTKRKFIKIDYIFDKLFKQKKI